MEDYIYKIGNFNGHMLHSCFNTEGFYDHFNSDEIELKAKGDKVIATRQAAGHKSGGKIRYEFVLCPNIGFLASPDLLMKDCELKLKFDRADAENALVAFDTITNACTGLDIEDCVQ